MSFIFLKLEHNYMKCVIPDSSTSLAQCHFMVGWVGFVGPTMAQHVNNDSWRCTTGPMLDQQLTYYHKTAVWRKNLCWAIRVGP